MKTAIILIMTLLISGCSFKLLPYKADFTDGVNEVGGKASNAIANRQFAHETIGLNNKSRDFSQYK